MEILGVHMPMPLSVPRVPPQHLLVGDHHVPGVDDDHVITHVLKSRDI